ncbi:MAG: TfoX/Sxy family protein [Calditrichota bacterium]
MAHKNEFVNYLLDLMEPFGFITAKSMFGGYGIYRDELMFGLVADDTLYLKVDKSSIPEFEEAESEPFTYVKNGKPMKMSYWTAPPETLENQDAMLEWAEKAWAAALRAKRK